MNAQFLSLGLIGFGILSIAYGLLARSRVDDDIYEVPPQVVAARPRAPRKPRGKSPFVKIAESFQRNLEAARRRAADAKAEAALAKQTPAPRENVTLEKGAIEHPPPIAEKRGDAIIASRPTRPSEMPSAPVKPWLSMLPFEIPGHLLDAMTIDKKCGLILALDAIGKPWCEPALTAAIQQEGDPELKALATAALARIRGEIPAQLERLDHETVVMNAVTLSEHQGEPALLGQPPANHYEDDELAFTRDFSDVGLAG